MQLVLCITETQTFEWNPLALVLHVATGHRAKTYLKPNGISLRVAIGVHHEQRENPTHGQDRASDRRYASRDRQTQLQIIHCDTTIPSCLRPVARTTGVRGRPCGATSRTGIAWSRGSPGTPGAHLCSPGTPGAHTPGHNYARLVPGEAGRRASTTLPVNVPLGVVYSVTLCM